MVVGNGVALVQLSGRDYVSRLRQRLDMAKDGRERGRCLRLIRLAGDLVESAAMDGRGDPVFTVPVSG